MSSTDTVILGAGPYGLSLSAHLTAAAVPHEIIGEPMYAWRKTMPQGMFLLTEAFASNLWAPQSGYKFADYCQKQNIPYQRFGMKLPLQTFIDYALWFQKELVKHARPAKPASVERNEEGFRVTLDDGQIINAQRVVLALGLQELEQVPPVFRGLPKTHLSHSAGIRDYDWAQGKDITIVGGGQSALGLAALMHEAGVMVRVLSRDETVNWNAIPDFKRSWFSKLLKPEGGLGPGWRAHILTEYPFIFHALSRRRRKHIVAHSWGPSAAWWLRDRIVGKVELRVNTEVTQATFDGSRISLQVKNKAGPSTLTTDHVIVATGFKADLRHYTFLSQDIIDGMNLDDGSPELTSGFETEIPGLYTLGPAAAQSFGPAVRFLYGAKYAAPCLARHIRYKCIMEEKALALAPA